MPELLPPPRAVPSIRDVQTGALNVPFNECHQAAGEPMRKLVGLTMGPGWRKTIA